ncbi:MAG: ComEA family DNA-binding protein [Ruminococcus sp.]|nr:ComEA family DNA-binding protein [Ruminococcus sp.]
MSSRYTIAIFITIISVILCASLRTVRNNEDSQSTETVVYIESTFISAAENLAVPPVTESVKPEKIPEPTTVMTATDPPEATTEEVTEPLWININTADAAELMKLDGIGEATAANIVAYREQYGDFRNIEELVEVEGIGEKKLEAIRDSIYVENPTYDTESEQTEIIDEPQYSEEQEDIAEEIYEPEYPEETEPPVYEEPTEPVPETEPPLTLETAAPININTAGIEELMLLPHVTEEIAQDIIDLREAIHGYSHIYELLYIEKLEQKQVAEICEFVTVGQ